MGSARAVRYKPCRRANSTAAVHISSGSGDRRGWFFRHSASGARKSRNSSSIGALFRCIPEVTISSQPKSRTLTGSSHLIQRFLDVLEAFRGHFNQAPSVPPQRANRANRPGRTKAGPQQTYGMQVLNPLAIGNLALSTGNVFEVVPLKTCTLRLIAGSSERYRFESYRSWCCS
jgi:hypothetical protein